MKNQNCVCSIVPEFVLEKMRETGDKSSIEHSIKTSSSLREKREKRPGKGGGEPTPDVPAGSADRYAYDCEHTTVQRKTLLRKEGDDAVSDEDANSVYDNCGIIRSYFQDAHGFNSVDNQGADLILNVHYDSNFNNAFWDGDEMTFGDGDGATFINFAKSLDVTAHELTHGVIQHTAGLIYNRQPGALNEHFADVFGSVIKQAHRNQTAETADWLIGDEIVGPDFPGEAIRNLKAPGTAYDGDPQPDHMDQYYSGRQDNYGVHINSGIPNKAFYLAASGIETSKAGLLWFETLKSLSSRSQFSDLYEVMSQKTSEMVGNGSLPTNTQQVVDDAFTAVGII